VLDAGVLDAVLGLTRAGEVPAGTLWRVTPASGDGPEAPDRGARARVLDADGTPLLVLPSGRVDVRAELPAGEPGRLLVLAERADPGWRAYLDHRRLEAVVHDGWAQAFVLPDEGGRVVVRHDQPWAGTWGVAQAVVLGLTALLALPVGGSARRRSTR
jgi:hypothetical protein